MDSKEQSLSIEETALSFLTSLPSEERQEKQQEVNRFIVWCGKERSICQITPLEVSNYAERVGASTGDIAKKLEPVKAFLSYAKKEKILKTSLASHLRVRQASSKSPFKTPRPTREKQRVVITEEGYAQFVAAKKLNGELDQKFRHLVNLERQKTQLESKIKEAGQSLITEHAVIQNKISELEASSQKLPQLKNELQQVQVQLRQFAEQEETLNQKRQSSQELRTSIHSLESDKARLEQEIAEIEEKLSLLLTESGAKCPLYSQIRANEAATVVLPVPPLPLAMAKIITYAPVPAWLDYQSFQPDRP